MIRRVQNFYSWQMFITQSSSFIKNKQTNKNTENKTKQKPNRKPRVWQNSVLIRANESESKLVRWLVATLSLVNHKELHRD